MEKIEFNGDKIAIIVRGKQGPDHKPGVMEQHADVVLSDGSPMGFFGGGSGYSGTGGSTGSGMTGMVFDHQLFEVNRPYYVSAETAKKVGMLSTVYVFEVTDVEAKLFTQFWTRLKQKPGRFSLLGDNCSTHASQAFRSAGILNSGIPGLDTPDNLFKQVNFKRSGGAVYSGFVGFEKNVGKDGFTMVVLN